LISSKSYDNIRIPNSKLIEGDELIGNSGYKNYEFEDQLKDERIEFRLSEGCNLDGKVRAVSFKGFVLKILMAIFSYNISRLVKAEA